MALNLSFNPSPHLFLYMQHFFFFLECARIPTSQEIQLFGKHVSRITLHKLLQQVPEIQGWIRRSLYPWGDGSQEQAQITLLTFRNGGGHTDPERGDKNYVISFHLVLVVTKYSALKPLCSPFPFILQQPGEVFIAPILWVMICKKVCLFVNSSWSENACKEKASFVEKGINPFIQMQKHQPPRQGYWVGHRLPSGGQRQLLYIIKRGNSGCQEN